MFKRTLSHTQRDPQTHPYGQIQERPWDGTNFRKSQALRCSLLIQTTFIDYIFQETTTSFLSQTDRSYTIFGQIVLRNFCKLASRDKDLISGSNSCC